MPRFDGDMVPGTVLEDAHPSPSDVMSDDVRECPCQVAGCRMRCDDPCLVDGCLCRKE